MRKRKGKSDGRGRDNKTRRAGRIRRREREFLLEIL